LFQARRVTVNR